MKLQKVHLLNFKAFKNSEVELSNLTVFSGLNGMGKSTFIQSLLLLRQSYELGRLNIKGGLVLEGEYSRPGKGKDIYALNGEGEIIVIDLTFDNAQSIYSSFAYSHSSDLQTTIRLESNVEFDQCPLFNGNFQYLNADRLSPERDTFPASQSNVDKGYLGKHGQFTVHYLAQNQRKAINIPALRHPLAKTDTLLDNVDAWLGDLAPGVKVIVGHYPELNVAKLAFTYETENGTTEEIRANNTGFGLTYVLPILTAILSASKDDIIIIENPESHLHPGGQAVLGRMFSIAAAHGIQLIIETHSDHVINGILISVKNHAEAEEEGIGQEQVKIYFIEREQKIHQSEIKTIQIDDQGRIRKAPANFFDQYSKDIKEMMGL